MKEIKIIPPEGYEVDKENSTFECVKFKPIVPSLPKTWEEFCATCPIKKEEAYISNISSVATFIDGSRNVITDKNLLPSEEIANAMLALCQLIQLRDCYNDDWKPDWSNARYDKWCIEINDNVIVTSYHQVSSRVLNFKSAKLRDKFLENFKDLIELAKPLL